MPSSPLRCSFRFSSASARQCRVSQKRYFLNCWTWHWLWCLLVSPLSNYQSFFGQCNEIQASDPVYTSSNVSEEKISELNHDDHWHWHWPKSLFRIWRSVKHKPPTDVVGPPKVVTITANYQLTMLDCWHHDIWEQPCVPVLFSMSNMVPLTEIYLSAPFAYNYDRPQWWVTHRPPFEQC